MSVALKAVFVCDDVRQEVGNKLTAVGLYNERLFFPPGAGAVGLPKLVIVFVVRGLRGVSRLESRNYLAPEGTEVQPANAVSERDPARDEHNFVLLTSPFVAPGPSRWRAVLDVIAGQETAHFEYAFEVLRMPAPGVMH